MAGALAGAVLLRTPLGTGTVGRGGRRWRASAARPRAGLPCCSRPARTRRAARSGMALTLLAVAALVAPSPLAVAAASVMKANLRTMLMVAVPIAVVAAALGWWHVARQEPATQVAGPARLGLALRRHPDRAADRAVGGADAERAPGQGRRARVLYRHLQAADPDRHRASRWPSCSRGAGSPRRWSAARWAPLLLAVGASGGLGRVFDETGMAELLAEYALHPRYGVLTPFLAAAIVKTMQGNSLTAVLTASGMVEPMLPALGLDSASGRALAAAAVGAGSMAVCHVNDPFFWIAAHGQLSPGRALYVISLGSA